MTAAAVLIDGRIHPFRRKGRRWLPARGLSGETYWLVVDAPDEAVQAGVLPPVGLFDRESLLARRLDEAFPGVRWRKAHLSEPWRRKARYAFFALPDEAAARAAVEGQEGALLAGVTTSAAAVWQSARKMAAPLIGLFLPHGFRLLACHEGMPSLTRLLPLSDPADLVAELNRTLVFLRRQGQLTDPPALICHGQPPEGWRSALEAAWRENGGVTWTEEDALALLAAHGRGVNLAPGELLRPLRARRLGRAAWALGVLAAGGSLIPGLDEVRALWETEQAIVAANQSMARLDARAREFERRLHEAKVPPATLRAAEALESRWRDGGESLPEDIVRLSESLGLIPGLRLDALAWQASARDGCSGGQPAPGPSAGPSRPGIELGRQASQTTPPTPVAPRALKFVLRLPDDLSPRSRADAVKRFADALADWPGGRLTTQARELSRKKMRSGEKVDTLDFCLEIEREGSGRDGSG